MAQRDYGDGARPGKARGRRGEVVTRPGQPRVGPGAEFPGYATEGRISKSERCKGQPRDHPQDDLKVRKYQSTGHNTYPGGLS